MKRGAGFYPARRFVIGALLACGFLQAEPVDKWVESIGGYTTRDTAGNIVELSIARSWSTDSDLDRIVGIQTLKKLDLSFTYVSDAGIEKLKKLKQLEDLTLDTDEFITDAAVAYLRSNRTLKRLNLRGTDITDISMPYIAELTGLKSLNISYTQLGDVGLESLPALTELEELDMGGTRISGRNLSVLKLLPKLKKLSFHGIQRRNAGACWSPLITDLDLDTIAMLSGLENLDLGIGISLGMGGKPAGRNTSAANEGNCRVDGGIKISDLGIAKLTKLKKLKRLDISGAKLTPAGLAVLQPLPELQRLSVWNCAELDNSAAATLAKMPSLTNLDISYTKIGDAGLQQLSGLPHLKYLYLTETKVSPDAVTAYKKAQPASFVSWATRPAPRPIPSAEPNYKANFEK
jgi:Leucine-rich repeat (LRR) protein